MSEKETKSAAAAALAKANKRNADIRGSTADTTYVREWKRFKTFVETKRKEGVLQPEEKYLSRTSIDLYCSEVVATLKCTPSTAQRIRPSLQFYADNFEYINKDFNVESEVMLSAFVTQQTSYANGQLD